MATELRMSSAVTSVSLPLGNVLWIITDSSFRIENLSDTAGKSAGEGVLNTDIEFPAIGWVRVSWVSKVGLYTNSGALEADEAGSITGSNLHMLHKLNYY